MTRSCCGLGELPSGARVGTGSLRRRAQLLYQRKDLHVTPIRGNVDTRLKKLDDGEVDALVMAAAGLKRIGRVERIAEYLPDAICVSAVAQGALAIETRADDVPTRERLHLLHDPGPLPRFRQSAHYWPALAADARCRSAPGREWRAMSLISSASLPVRMAYGSVVARFPARPGRRSSLDSVWRIN